MGTCAILVMLGVDLQHKDVYVRFGWGNEKCAQNFGGWNVGI